jgi:hypothetical protein
MALDKGGGWKNAVTYSYATPLGATLYMARIRMYERCRRQCEAHGNGLGKYPLIFRLPTYSAFIRDGRQGHLPNTDFSSQRWVSVKPGEEGNFATWQ